VDTEVVTFLIMWRCVCIASAKDELFINEKIRVPELMVIGPNGEQMGVKKLDDALTLASYAGLDLVLMSPDAKPPVGKIMDYNRYRYERQKKQKEALKKQRETNKAIKEFQLSVTIDKGDLEVRRKRVEEYLQKGHKIKVSLLFKGRQNAHPELGIEVMNRFIESLSEVAIVETEPKLEGRRLHMLLAPKK
jgi:translation initiation factor IF-3